MKKHSILLFAMIGLLAHLTASAQELASGGGPDRFGQDRHLYWGDVHGHTNASDGKGSVEECFHYARHSAKLDFAMVTDHDFGSRAPWRMPKAQWQSLQTQARALTVDGAFVAIEGYEWTSQPKYWSGFTNGASERLFEGPPKFYSHKNVYFPARVDDLFSAKDFACRSPDLLAAAVRKAGGLIHNNHPTADPDSREQFDYERACFSVIANTEMLADEVWYRGKAYPLRGDALVMDFLNRGGRTGFVGASDTHVGQPEARTAVFASALTREGIFEALRQRRCYAVSSARIVLDFKVNGHWMGEEIEIDGAPRIAVSVLGTAPLKAVEVVRSGTVVHRVSPEGAVCRFEWDDAAFAGNHWYALRVIQADEDTDGNPSRAWASPVWVKARRKD